MGREIRLNDRVRLIRPSDETKKDHSLLSVGDEGIMVFRPIKFDPDDGKWKPYPGDFGVRWDKGQESLIKQEEVEVL